MNPDVSPRLVLEDPQPLLALLRAGQELLWRDPAAAAALLQAVTAEGRRFAATPEGERWMRAFGGSELVQRGRMIWQAFGLDALAEGSPAQLPSDWLRHVLDALGSADLEETLTQMMVEEVNRGVFPAA